MKDSTTNLIGIRGKIGAGKDMVGTIIQCLTYNSWIKHNDDIKSVIRWAEGSDELPKKNLIYPNWKIKKFADGVDQTFKIITGDDYHGVDRKKKEKLRPLYREFAEKTKEVFGDDVWTKVSFRDYKGINLKAMPMPDDISNLYEAYMHDKCDICGESFTGYKRQYRCWDCTKSNNPIFPNWIFTDVRFPSEWHAIKSRGGIIIEVVRDDIEQDDHYTESLLDGYQSNYLIGNNSTIDHVIKQVQEILKKENIKQIEI